MRAITNKVRERSIITSICINLVPRIFWQFYFTLVFLNWSCFCPFLLPWYRDKLRSAALRKSSRQLLMWTMSTTHQSQRRPLGPHLPLPPRNISCICPRRIPAQPRHSRAVFSCRMATGAACRPSPQRRTGTIILRLILLRAVSRPIVQR